MIADEQRDRRFWLVTALIVGAWGVFGLVLANQGYMQSGLRGRPVLSLADALRPGLLEALLWVFSTFAIFWLARRFPLERGRVLFGVAVHVVGAVVMSLARTGIWVFLGQHVSWIGERDFRVQFWGTSTQNFSIYALLVGIAHVGLHTPTRVTPFAFAFTAIPVAVPDPMSAWQPQKIESCSVTTSTHR